MDKKRDIALLNPKLQHIRRVEICAGILLSGGPGALQIRDSCRLKFL